MTIMDTVDDTAMYPGHYGEEWGWECGCCGACAVGNGETDGGN